MTRFLLLDKPSCAPHFDLVTRDTSCGSVFDMGVDLEGYDGSVFIKVSDIQEMARSIGMLSAEDAKLITDENKRLRDQINHLPAQTEVLKNELDNLLSNFHSRLSLPDGNSILDPDSSKTDESDDRESELDGQGDILDLLRDK